MFIDKVHCHIDDKMLLNKILLLKKFKMTVFQLLEVKKENLCEISLEKFYS